MKNWVFLFLVCCPLFGSEWIREELHKSWGQAFEIDEILYEEKTTHQHLLIFKNDIFGRVLALDGVIQNTEKDEFVYHEMLVHVPLVCHGSAKHVLVIGGGDGGALREVIKHKTVEKVTLVEIDESVIHFSKKYLPHICEGVFDDPRLEVVIQDGCQFVKETKVKYDVILCDSTDPEGPGKVLFTEEFYDNCHAILAEGGIFVNQNGVPFLQKEEFVDTFRKRKKSFQETGYYLAVIPTYAGGFMALGFASDTPGYQTIPVEVLESRLNNVTGQLRYYTPEVHKASFALPQFMKSLL